MQRPSLTPARSISNDSALQGAALAFRSSPSPSNRNVFVPPSTSIGALAAASRAGSDAVQASSPPASTKKVNTLQTGDISSIAKRQTLQRNSSQFSGRENALAGSIKREVSPSYIAATRAASRSRMSTIQDGPPNDSTQQSKLVIQPKAITEVATDETSIPPTSRLVELFEAKQRAELPLSEPSGKGLALPANDNIISPTPTRPSFSIRLRAPSIPLAIVPDPVKVDSISSSTSKSPERLVKKRPSSTISTSTISLNQDAGSGTKTRQPPPVPAPRRTTQRNKATGSEMPPPTQRKTQQRHLASPSQVQNKPSRSPPSLPPTARRRPASVGPIAKAENSKSLAQSAAIPPALPRRISHLQLGGSQLTAESLANAIVASSLASSRAPSPAHSHKPEPILPQHSGKAYSISSFLLLHSPTHPSFQSKPLPKAAKPAGLRQTLRHTISSSEEEGSKHRNHQHKHGLLVKKHPNKHAEGSRRRWRDTITERERKRYEGVWAANKGILMQHESIQDSTATRDDVHGFVVREIWSRSGLSTRTLREIWDLVESGGSTSSTNTKRRGRLKKHEFVVGLWLVDQCLKGRKLPTAVQESVWDSARELMSGFRAR